ncbi:MAG: hypothetical protein V4485_03485 [Pseudomonadota bacterium]
MTATQVNTTSNLIPVPHKDVKAAAHTVADTTKAPYTASSCCGGAFDSTEAVIKTAAKEALITTLTAALAQSPLPKSVQDALVSSIGAVADQAMTAVQGQVHNGVKSLQVAATAKATELLSQVARDKIEAACTSSEHICNEPLVAVAAPVELAAAPVELAGASHEPATDHA